VREKVRERERKIGSGKLNNAITKEEEEIEKNKTFFRFGSRW